MKQKIEKWMKMEQNPLVYLEYIPNLKPVPSYSLKKLFSQWPRDRTNMRYCIGYVSHPYEDTFRITTCRHLVASKMGKMPSKAEILEGLEVFARFEGVNKRFHSLMFEDVNIKIHQDELTDLLFIEITRPTDYNFMLLNQASVSCKKRFPGSEVYYFQNHEEEDFFRLFEGKISTEKVYITIKLLL